MKTFGSLTHKHGIITDCNERACEMLGMARQEIISSNLFDYMDEADKKKALDVMTKHMEFLLDYKFRHPNGGSINVTVWPEAESVSTHVERTVFFKVNSIEQEVL